MFKNAALQFFVLQVSTAMFYAQNSGSPYDEFSKQSGGIVFHLNKDELATVQGAFFSKTIEGQMGGYLL